MEQLVPDSKNKIKIDFSSFTQGKTLNSRRRKVLKELVKNRYLYIMLVPVVLYFIIFHYFPMYGLIIAFQDYFPSAKNTNFFTMFISGKWVGLRNFMEFFNGPYFFRTLKNTLVISFTSIMFLFPLPILFALLLNEIKNSFFKRTVQTITYIPHFFSIVVVVGMIFDFFSTQGIVNSIITSLGGDKIQFLSEPSWFVPLYIGSIGWQETGWMSIIYLSALTSIDGSLYEAAIVDGAGRWKQLIYITLPGMLPTIIILLILRIGQVMNVGFERVFLMYNPAVYETADVISTYVYRSGIQGANYGFASAVGLFNSVTSFILLVTANKIGKKLTDTGLW